MGANVTKEQSITNLIDTSITNTFVNEVINQNTQSTSTDTVNLQSMMLKGAKIKCANLNASQLQNVKVETIGQFNADAGAKMDNSVATQITTTLNNTLDKVVKTDVLTEAAKAAGCAGGNCDDKQTIKNTIKTSVENTLQNTFTTENLNVMRSKLYSTQLMDFSGAELEISGECNFSQEQNIEEMRKNIMTSVSSALQANTALTQLITDITNSAKSEELGTFASILDGVAGIFKGLFGPIIWIIGGAIALTIVGVIFYFVMKSSGGSGQPQQGFPQSFQAGPPGGFPQPFLSRPPQGFPQPFLSRPPQFGFPQRQ